jgi:hypothetical protein
MDAYSGVLGDLAREEGGARSGPPGSFERASFAALQESSAERQKLPADWENIAGSWAAFAGAPAGDSRGSK